MRTILNLSSAAILLVGLAFAAGCGSSRSHPDAAVAVTASTTQLGDFAREVGGDRAAVTQILAANSDPHEYEPKPSDAESLIDADLILKSGGDLDAWLDQIVASSGSDAPELTLIDDIPTLGGDDETDPHWWQDPRNAIKAVRAIDAELSAIDPEGKATYDENARRYITELHRLDAKIAACMEAVPVDQRKLVTSHDGLGYYADRYDIDVIGAAIPALSTNAQASAGETADLVELIRRAGVTTVYSEAGVSSQLELAIADEAGASVGGELWADTLGPVGSDGATYIEALESNTAKLVDGFTGGVQSCPIQLG